MLYSCCYLLIRTEYAEEEAQHSHAIKAKLQVDIGEIDSFPLVSVGARHVHRIVDAPGAAEHHCLVVRPH